MKKSVFETVGYTNTEGALTNAVSIDPGDHVAITGAPGDSSTPRGDILLNHLLQFSLGFQDVFHCIAGCALTTA